MKKHVMITLLIFSVSAVLRADTLSLSFNQNVTDNLFQNRYGESDRLSNLGFYLDKNLGKFSLYTQGSYSYLFENPNLTYYVQDIGADALHALNQRSALYFSLSGRGAFYRADYGDFNYASINAFAAFKSYLSPTSIFKSNYTFEYKNYSSSLFDFSSHAFMISLDKFFQTKTTLKLEANWGYKTFLHPYQTEEFTTTGSPNSQGGKGRGRGRAGNQNQFLIRSQSEGQGIQVFSLGGLVAQGLGSRVGINLTGMKQWNLSGQNPFAYVEEYYAVENPSYDRFSWQGYQLGSQISIVLPWNIRTKLGYTLSVKEFPGIESFDIEGISMDEVREDTREQFEARLEKDFPAFSVFLSYYFIDNKSNDFYFDWEGQFFSLGVEWNLSLGGK